MANLGMCAICDDPIEQTGQARVVRAYSIDPDLGRCHPDCLVAFEATMVAEYSVVDAQSLRMDAQRRRNGVVIRSASTISDTRPLPPEQVGTVKGGQY